MLNKINVACIDDDDVYTFAVRKLIERSQIADKTNFFHNGQVAIDFLLENARNIEQLPDLILLDLNMPILDGWQFLDEFEKLKPDLAKEITIYITSSTIDDEDLKRARSLKTIIDIIEKPITVNLLQDIRTQMHK